MRPSAELQVAFEQIVLEQWCDPTGPKQGKSKPSVTFKSIRFLATLTAGHHKPKPREHG